MNQISCDVCLDLMPLVKDGIASEESCSLVMSHIEGCANCAAAYGVTKAAHAHASMDDPVVLTKLKKQITLLLLSVIFAGTLIGMALSDGMGMFYNAIIMPAIGGFGYMLLRKNTYLVPFGLFLFSFIWVSVREIAGGFLTYSSISDLLSMSALWSAIFAAFTAIGSLIGWLLHYAFKKEV
jgi:hypothetical protein